MHDEADVRKQLVEVEAELHTLTSRLLVLQARHDVLLRQLLDTAGAHDQRPVAVR